MKIIWSIYFISFVVLSVSLLKFISLNLFNFLFRKSDVQVSEVKVVDPHGNWKEQSRLQCIVLGKSFFPGRCQTHHVGKFMSWWNNILSCETFTVWWSSDGWNWRHEWRKAHRGLMFTSYGCDDNDIHQQIKCRYLPILSLQPIDGNAKIIVLTSQRLH